MPSVAGRSVDDKRQLSSIRVYIVSTRLGLPQMRSGDVSNVSDMLVLQADSSNNNYRHNHPGRGGVMDNWCEAIDLLSATRSFDKPQGGVSIDNAIIKAIAALMSERDRYREDLEAALECLENNGFGKAYVIDIIRDSLRGEEVENDH